MVLGFSGGKSLPGRGRTGPRHCGSGVTGFQGKGVSNKRPRFRTPDKMFIVEQTEDSKDIYKCTRPYFQCKKGVVHDLFDFKSL